MCVANTSPLSKVCSISDRESRPGTLCLVQHAAREVDHCTLLVDWMHKHGFLKEGENPKSVPPTLETKLVNAYCFCRALRESCENQAITMNLISESVNYDFFSAVIPVFARLGLKTNRYWTIHKDIDQQHLTMGIDNRNGR